jgi:hypothetical protein
MLEALCEACHHICEGVDNLGLWLGLKKIPVFFCHYEMYIHYCNGVYLVRDEARFQHQGARA